MKITEIFDVQNSDNNLALGQNTYILIHDYENYKNRLHHHSTNLELLTQKTLNLFKAFPQKLKIAKPSYHTKIEKLKHVGKTKIQGIVNRELIVIKKLLMINLRSLKIINKLFKENKELQILLNNSHIVAKKQKQRIEYVQNENESLKKTEIHLKKRLDSFLRQLNRASKSFIAGFKNENCDNEVSLNNDKRQDQRNSQKLQLAFTLSTNIAYRLHDDANTFLKINNVQQQLSFSYDMVLKIRSTPRIIEWPSNNFFNNFDMYIDRQMTYPLLTWQTKKPIENHDRKSDLKELHPKLNECAYKIEKDIQNAIRLHSVNSSVWKSFLLMKTIQEFVIFNQLCELIKAFLVAGEACESKETSSEIIPQTTIVQLENVNTCSFISETTSKCTSQSSLTSKKITDGTPTKRTEKYTRKRFPKIKALYSLKKKHKKIINCDSSKKKIKTRFLEKQSCTIIRKSISTGVGDSYITSVDQESQVDNDIFVKLTVETDCDEKNTNLVETDCDEKNTNLRNSELSEKNSSTKTLASSRKDFRKSLKSLEEIIKSCQLKSDQEGKTLSDTLRKRHFDNEGKNIDAQRKFDTKVKDPIKKKRKSFDSYKKENRNISHLPEMRQMYQIILENKLSQGVSFEYLSPDKSKVQLLFISKSRSKML